MRRLIRYLQSLFLPEGDHDLQVRFFQGLCLLGGFVALFVVVPANAYQGLPVLINLASAAYGILAFVLYAFARRGRVYPLPLFVGLIATLTVSWFPNAGSAGSVAFYFFAAVMFPVIFFHGALRVVSVGLAVAICLALLWIEYFNPTLVTPFRQRSDLYLDLSSGFLMTSLACTVMLLVVLTGYRRERQRLSEARWVLSTMIDSTDDMVWLVDTNTFGLLAFNSAFTKVPAAHGVQATLGVTPDVMFPPEEARTWRDLYARALKTGPFSIELPSDDRVHLLTLSPVRHGDSVTGISVFAKEITERKRIDAQILQAQKMESLGSLAGGVAHDFNNMLAGIMGYTDLLLLDERSADRRESLDAILQAATRSRDLTKKLLAFARRGKNIVEPVELKAIVRDSLAILQPSIQHGVSTLSQLEETWTIDGDPSQISQLVVNLCINANEAMPAGGTLGFRTRNVTLDGAHAQAHSLPPGDYVELRISDTGIGIPDGVKARVYEPFFTTKVAGATSGTGLGLSTVYGIVQVHQGAIAFESAAGAGTTFTVYLPKGVLNRGPKSDVIPTAAGRGLILIVDDEAQFRQFLAAALSWLGYSTLTARDGEEGAQTFRERHQELTGVILDLKMPRKNGREAFAEMQTLNPDVPVLICSGYGENEEVQSLITLGAKGLMAKPFRLSDLSEQMRKLRS